MQQVIRGALRLSGWVVVGIACGGALGVPRAALAAESDGAVVGSLQAAMSKHVGHAREWLEQADYKSLHQSAGSLQLLAALLKAKSDDAAWQAALGRVETAVGEMQAAAKAEDAAGCRTGLERVGQAAEAARSLVPVGKPQSAPRAPAVRPLMLIMDSIYADAKIALVTGNAAAAKKQALVLAELGELVSNSRQTEPWRSLAGELVAAANAAAESAATDPPAVRQLLRGIAQKCEACHEMRGR
jgi:cytochrome c556